MTGQIKNLDFIRLFFPETRSHFHASRMKFQFKQQVVRLSFSTGDQKQEESFKVKLHTLNQEGFLEQQVPELEGSLSSIFQIIFVQEEKNELIYIRE